MARKYFSVLILVFFIAIITSTLVLAKDYGSIEGNVKDVQTNEPLPYANIVIVGTSWGTTSDMNGNYLLVHLTCTL